MSRGVVGPESQSVRLRQLHVEYARARADADAAAERLRSVTDAIKQELQSAAPDEKRIVLPPNGIAPALSLSLVETWRLDTARLRREQLETYVRYAKRSESWVLRALPGGGE